MTAPLVFIGFAIIIGLLLKIEKDIRKLKEVPVEDYLASVAVNEINEALKKANRIAEENGVDLDEDD
ncbi:MAG TPA: hypothetical protein VFE87_02625 [Candidatus Paceibacterota bacterium]|nr:hypothetical protein [Candidatus Paceibacterota bacterium]